MVPKKHFIPVVKAVVAELSRDRSIRDVKNSDTLLQIGILPDRIPELVLRLFRVVRGRRFDNYLSLFQLMAITPNSSIEDIAAQLADAGDRLSMFGITPLRDNLTMGDNPTEPWGDVEAAVHTAVAEMSRTHSLGEIRSDETLDQLGLDEADVANVKINVFRMMSSLTVHPKLSEFLDGIVISGGSTIGETVANSRRALMKVKGDATDIWG